MLSNTKSPGVNLNATKTQHHQMKPQLELMGTPKRTFALLQGTIASRSPTWDVWCLGPQALFREMQKQNPPSGCTYTILSMIVYVCARNQSCELVVKQGNPRSAFSVRLRFFTLADRS